MIPLITHSMEDKKYSVEELVKAYMAGLVDGCGTFGVRIASVDDYDVGYSVSVAFRFRNTREAVMADFSGWAEDQGLSVKIKKSSTVQIAKLDDIETLIDILRPFVRSKQIDMDILSEEIIPRIKNDEHLNEDGLIELMAYVEQLPSYDVSKRTYTQDYFIEEFKTDTAQ